MARKRELEIRVSQELINEYHGLFEEEVPIDLSRENLLLAGLKALIGQRDSKITLARTPTEEFGARKMELAKLEQDLAEKQVSRDEQLRILDQHLKDRESIEQALPALERRIACLQKRLGVGVRNPLRSQGGNTP